MLSKQLIGFDIGEKCVKIAVCSGGSIKKVASEDLPDNLVTDGKIFSLDAMADFLHQAAKDNGIPFGDAALLLPSQEVYVRTVTMPAMSDQQMKYNLAFVFKDYLTKNKADYTFDYSVSEILDEDTEAPQMRFIACAVQTSLIESYRAMFKKAGFKLKVAIPEEIAIGNVLEKFYKESGREKADLCLVDLGYRGTRVHMFHGSEHSAKTTLGKGGISIDEIIAEDAGVDVHMAASYKVSNYNRVLNSSHVEEAFRTLGIDIMKAVHFYNYNHREEDISEMYLFGGGSGMEPLRRQLKEDSEMNVKEASELLGKKGSGIDGMYLMACGCALNEV